MLPELILITCEACGGEGCTLSLTEAAGDGLPAEHSEPCVVCGGSGEVEVCEGCFEAPEILNGLEVCGCVAATLKRAA